LSEGSIGKNIIEVSKGEQRRDIRCKYTSKLVPGAMLEGAVDPNMASMSTDEPLLRLRSGDGAGNVGALVLMVEELVTEVVLNFVHGIVEDVVGLLVLEAVALIVLGLKVVAFFRTHAGAILGGLEMLITPDGSAKMKGELLIDNAVHRIGKWAVQITAGHYSSSVNKGK